MFMHKHVADSLKARFNLLNIDCAVTPKGSVFGRAMDMTISRGGLSGTFSVEVFENPFFSFMGPASWVNVSVQGAIEDSRENKARFVFQRGGGFSSVKDQSKRNPCKIRNGIISMESVYADRLYCTNDIAVWMADRMGAGPA